MSDETSVGTEEPLVGFRSPSPREGYTRIYSSLAFRDYCEVRDADMTYSGLLDDADTDGPTVVWVPAEAHVDYVKVEALTGTAAYVMGVLRAQFPAIDGPDSHSFDSEPKTKKENPVSTVFACSPPVTPVLYCVSDVYPPCPS